MKDTSLIIDASPIEWDEEKRDKVIKDRGVDFLYAALIFENPVFVARDGRSGLDYGEDRYRALGLVNGECFIVVFTLRGDAVRLITAWRGGRRDRENYQAYLSGRAEEDG